MQTLNITWSFYFAYNHHKGELFLHTSSACQSDHKVPSEMTLDLNQMKSWIHKYDYRKFEYFAKQEIKKPFDTVIRLKCEASKKYIRTQAICQRTAEGFHCVLIEDRQYHELTKKMVQFHPKEANFIWLDETLSNYESSKQLRNIKQHLTTMMIRDTI